MQPDAAGSPLFDRGAGRAAAPSGLYPQRECPLMPPRMHHVGFVVTSIAESANPLASALSLAWDGVVIHDPLQFPNVTFLTSEGSTIELVEPAGPRSPVRKFAEAGGGLHHV